MDGTSLYPDGFHPDRHNRSKSAQARVKGRYRLHAAPVFYYFIDFGFSSKYEGEGPWLAWGTHGQDRDAPELKITGGHRYDPFALDVFTLGNVFRKSFVQKYRNLNFLDTLVNRMTSHEPADRPTISEALAIFEPIYSVRDRPAFRRRLHPYHEDRRTRCFRDFVASYWDMGHMSYYFVTYWYHILTLQRPWKS